jgi:murein L,D-transpeptidase YcbB/YkuD
MGGAAAVGVCVLALGLAVGALACGWSPPAPPAGAAQSSAPPEPVEQQLRMVLEGARIPPAVRRQGERLQAWKALSELYRRRGDQPVWWDAKTGVHPGAAELLAVLDGLAGDGLDLRLYPRQELRSLADEVRAEASGDGPLAPQAARRVADLDLGLSYTFMTVAAHLSLGRLQPSETARMGWHLRRPPLVDLVAALQGAVGNAGAGQVTAALTALAPKAEGYGKLKRALASYRDLASRGGWPAIPDGPRLRPSASGPRVAALAARLAASGDLAPEAAAARPGGRATGIADASLGGQAPGTAAAVSGGPGTGAAGAGRQALFDDALSAALAHFQARHGIEPTAGGGVDATTLAALNVPVERRARQIELNLERWRWISGDFGERYILVNVPAFQLSVVEHGRTVASMRVIVGKEQRATPVFSDLLTQIVLNPTWHIPDSIVAQEIAPQLRKDPGYLRRKGIEIKRQGAGTAEVDAGALSAAEIDQLGRHGSPLRLRQPPGPQNPLGRYKFLFPNQFDVYLHDTPAGELFERSRRTFSHGCVRIEKPDELAQYLLAGDPRWTPEAVAAKLATGESETITLASPLPVYILYLTAWVEADGTPNFRADVYDEDARLDEALAAETPLWDDLAALIAPRKAARRASPDSPPPRRAVAGASAAQPPPALANERLDGLRHRLGEAGVAEVVGVHLVGLEARIEEDLAQGAAHHRHAVALAHPVVHLGVAAAEERASDGHQHRQHPRRQQLADDLAQRLLGALDRHLAQHVVAAELDDHQPGVLCEHLAQARQPVGRGVARHPVVEHLAPQASGQHLGKAVTGGRADARGDRVAQADDGAARRIEIGRRVMAARHRPQGGYREQGGRDGDQPPPHASKRARGAWQSITTSRPTI